MPQKSLNLGPIVFEETQLPGKIFEAAAINASLSNLMSPNPLVLFCRNQRDGKFEGDIIPGFSDQLCNDFFLAPTHTGICITKNMNVKEILHTLDDDYNTYFETEKQTSKLNVSKDNYWAISTFVINPLKMDPTKV